MGRQVIIKPVRPDWYAWRQADAEWCQQFAEMPGVFFVKANDGSWSVQYHTSHVPFLPSAAQDEHAVVEAAQRKAMVLPFENSGLLRGYQQADLQRLKLLKGVLLAYEMRLGKTPLACHLHDPKDGILLVCGPLAARESWRDWIERTLGVPPWLLYGRKTVAAEPGYLAYFCHYDVLNAQTEFLATQRIGTLVLDEMHVLQSERSERTNAVTSLTFRASKILGLTGTPMWNKPKSLYTLLQLLNPAAWGTKFNFRVRYCDAQTGAYGWTYDGLSNAEELYTRINTIMVRRTWADVAPELPPTTRIVEPVELSGTAYAAIESAAMKATLARGTSNEAAYKATLRRKLAEAKLKPARDMALQAANDGHKVVLWVWHNEIGDKLHAILKDATGDVDPDCVYRLQSSDPGPKREAIIDAFRHHPETAFLVAAIGVGGVGLDLSCADYAIFVELDWTPSNNQQAEKRTFHLSRPDVVVYLHTDNPIETALMETLDVKNGFAAALGMTAVEIERQVLK